VIIVHCNAPNTGDADSRANFAQFTLEGARSVPKLKGTVLFKNEQIIVHYDQRNNLLPVPGSTSKMSRALNVVGSLAAEKAILELFVVADSPGATNRRSL